VSNRLVVTIGTFDLFHTGHVALFERMRHLAGPEGKVLVGINADIFVAHSMYKSGEWPIVGEQHRRAVVQTNQFVDWTRLHGEHGEATVRWLNEVAKDFPDWDRYLVVGSDWAKKDYYAQTGLTQEWLDQQGWFLLYVPYTPSISTTAIKEVIWKRKT